MSFVSWPGGSIHVDEFCALYVSSCSDVLMSSAPDEVQYQHAIEIVATGPVNHRRMPGSSATHTAYYSSAIKRDAAFSRCTGPTYPLMFRGKMITVKLEAIRLVHQVWEELDDNERRVHVELWAAEDREPTVEERGNFGLKFYWVGIDTPTLVRYPSEQLRDEDALALFEVLKVKV